MMSGDLGRRARAPYLNEGPAREVVLGLFEDLCARLRAEIVGHFLDQSGLTAGQLELDPTLAEPFLSHPSAQVRYLALAYVGWHWAPDAAADAAMAAARDEPDLDVRVAAIAILQLLPTTQGDQRIRSFLLRLIADEAQPASARRQAYSVLLDYYHPHYSRLTDDEEEAEEFSLDEVDWPYLYALGRPE